MYIYLMPTRLLRRIKCLLLQIFTHSGFCHAGSVLRACVYIYYYVSQMTRVFISLAHSFARSFSLFHLSLNTTSTMCQIELFLCVTYFIRKFHWSSIICVFKCHIALKFNISRSNIIEICLGCEYKRPSKNVCVYFDTFVVCCSHFAYRFSNDILFFSLVQQATTRARGPSLLSWKYLNCI